MLIKTVCILVSGLLTVFPRVFAPVEGSVNRTERPFRDEICLNGLWDFQPADLPQDYLRGGGVDPQLPLPSDNGWDDVKIRIPSPWNVNSFACNCLEGPDHRNYPSYPEKWDEVKMAWIRRNITIPQNWDGRRIELRFDAVARTDHAQNRGWERHGHAFHHVY